MLLFSYGGKSAASGSLSVRTARWKPRPKRTVVVGATVKSGSVIVHLNMDAQLNLMATITARGKTTQMTRGAKSFGNTTVAIIPATWTASINTPTLTVTAQQVCSHRLLLPICLFLACS